MSCGARIFTAPVCGDSCSFDTPKQGERFQDFSNKSFSQAGPPSTQVELAVAFTRGIEGRVKPAPETEAADSNTAIALLRYAAAIQAADTEVQ